jgi:hypothetical protein
MIRIRSKQGFALPMALMVMVVLTAGIAAGYAATSAETVNNAAHRGDTRAYNLAVAGLEQFLARRNEAGFCAHCLADPTSATADSEWTTVNLTGGYALVTAVRVRKHITDTLPALFFVRSMGVDTSIKVSGSTRSVNGTRIVGMYATWNTATVNVQGAWFALSGLTKNGTAGEINGTDQCSAADGGGKPTVAGAVLPAGQFSGKTDAFSGSPAIDSTKSFSSIKDSAKLDWAGILAGSISADFDVPTVSFPSSAWFTSNPTAWPIIRIRRPKDFSLPNAGRGMIIVDSDFTISGSNMWDGIVLVGGALTSNGNNTTAGATFAGLNYLIGGTPGGSADNSDANGQKSYTYNSCNVTKASKGLQAYKTWTNTYIDLIPVW